MTQSMVVGWMNWPTWMQLTHLPQVIPSTWTRATAKPPSPPDMIRFCDKDLQNKCSDTGAPRHIYRRVGGGNKNVLYQAVFLIGRQTKSSIEINFTDDLKTEKFELVTLSVRYNSNLYERLSLLMRAHTLRAYFVSYLSLYTHLPFHSQPHHLNPHFFSGPSQIIRVQHCSRYFHSLF